MTRQTLGKGHDVVARGVERRKNARSGIPSFWLRKHSLAEQPIAVETIVASFLSVNFNLPKDLLEQAFLSVIDIVARLDESIPTGNYRIVPSTIVWMLEKTTPVLFLQIEDADFLPALTELVSAYAELRSRAAVHQAVRAYVIAREDSLSKYTAAPYRLTFDDLESALSEENPLIGHLFRELFAEVAPAIRRRLARMDTLDWGDAHLETPAGDDPSDESDTFHQDEYEFYRAFCDPYLGDDPVESVVDLMIQRLIDADTGRRQDYWEKVDASVVSAAASSAAPILMAEVHRQGRLSELTQALECRIGELHDAEQVWQRLGAPLRALLANHAGSDQAIRIIEASANPHVGPPSPYLSYVAVYWMFCRRLSFSCEQQVLPQVCLETSPVIDAIRRDPASQTTCYIVSAFDVIRIIDYVSPFEKCLIVRLPDSMSQLLDRLAEDTGVKRFFSQCSEARELRLNLTPNHAFWVLESKFLAHLYQFKNRLPVVYVFEECCVFVPYAFNPFVDLQEKLDTNARDLPSVTIETGKWRNAAEFYAMRLPNGTQIKPVLFSEVRDLTVTPFSPDEAEVSAAGMRHK